MLHNSGYLWLIILTHEEEVRDFLKNKNKLCLTLVKLHVYLRNLLFGLDLLLKNWDKTTKKQKNPFATDNTLLCGYRFEVSKAITIHVVLRKQFLQDFLVILKRFWR